MAYVLGIDTGGTNTDCALLDRKTQRLVCSSKAPTTKEQLSLGISHAIDDLDIPSFDDVALVCLSTTLATNAIVEEKGCKTGIILIGKEPDKPLPTNYCKVIRGKLDIRGRETVTMSEAEIKGAVREMASQVEAIAVSGFASVRNPSQELRVKDIIEKECHLPVFCAHQLTGTLGFWERTVTAALNASLVKIICDFITETRSALYQKQITAPMMIVRSDGTLMTESVAKLRPIETILSGPAASILGAKHLTNMDDAFILDMGGTTTDIANLEDGRIKLNADGARVNGWLTRCKAADVSTYGIGGDSDICLNKEGQIQIGPQKVKPSCFSDNHSTQSGLTPTDILHITGHYVAGDPAASEAALKRFAKELKLADMDALFFIREEITRKLATACVQAAADFAGNDFSFSLDPAASFLLNKAFRQDEKEFLKAEIHLRKPVIAVGAPVSAWLPAVIEKLHGQLVIPAHAEVANAVGAAVAKFFESAEGLIRPQKETKGYLVYLPDRSESFSDYNAAVAYARAGLSDHLRKRMQQYGINRCHIDIEETPVYTTNFTCSNKKTYIETRIVAASGVPLGK